MFDLATPLEMTSAIKLLKIEVKQQVHKLPRTLDFGGLVSCQAILVSRSGSPISTSPAHGKVGLGCCTNVQGVRPCKCRAPLPDRCRDSPTSFRHFLLDQQRPLLVVIAPVARSIAGFGLCLDLRCRKNASIHSSTAVAGHTSGFRITNSAQQPSVQLTNSISS